MAKVSKSNIRSSSTAEYFSKNLQQVGFSSPIKAVLTTLKEAIDNSLDACEEAGILPDLTVLVQKIGEGSLKNSDRILVRVEDNGPGLSPEDVPKVFGEYLASSKFGKGRCSRGQQGIGISAATTWAMQTAARGVGVITKQKKSPKAYACTVDIDLKNNRGLVKDKKNVDWTNHASGTVVEFLLDGKIQLNGESGLLSYMRGTLLLNPHLSLSYKIGDAPEQKLTRVSEVLPRVPEAAAPHPHTMKLGEFRSHARLFGRISLEKWFQTGFSRLNPATIDFVFKEHKLPKNLLSKTLEQIAEKEFETLYAAIQRSKLMAPSTSSVFALGEDALALSLQRLGKLDYFSVVSRSPAIVDFKPVQVEVAIARLAESSTSDSTVQVLRFANRVPLQFDKAACAIVKAICDVNWKAYGLKQSRNSLPEGPYVLAVSIVSPFLKFKNASKETLDATEELVEEIRLACIKAGQRLSRYLNRENRVSDLEKKQAHLEQFGPALVEALCRILKAPETRREKAQAGLTKLLEKDTKVVKEDLKKADDHLDAYLSAKRKRMSKFFEVLDSEKEDAKREVEENREGVEEVHLAAKMPKTLKDKSTKKAEPKPVKVTKKAAPKPEKVKKKAEPKPVKKLTKKAEPKPAKKVAKKPTKPALKKQTKPAKKIAKKGRK